MVNEFKLSDTEDGNNIKRDSEKPKMYLLPTSVFKSIGNVMTYGAKTYGENTWQQVEEKRYLAALIRHLISFMDDPDGVDEESGFLHVEHLLCNAAFLNDIHTRKKENSNG